MSWRKIKKVELLVIHCSATRPDQDIGVEEISRWHRMRGFLTVGYHYVIKRDGTLERGRSNSIPGAHAKGYNHKSLGICLVGGLDDNGIPNGAYTDAQYITLEALLKQLVMAYPKAKVLGHRDLPNVVKACPCFDAADWWNEKFGVINEP